MSETIRLGELRGRIIVPLDMRNDNSSSTHWRAGYAKSKQAQRAFDNGTVTVEPYHDRDKPVNLVVTRVLGKGQRRWDADSILRGRQAKALVDCLTKDGWINDDGPRWVALALGNQIDNTRDKGPAVIISVYQ